MGIDPDTTNNRMELTALIRGFDLIPEGTPAVAYTDSRLAVQTITEWAKGWERAGWKRKTGPIKNLDLVQELYAKHKRTTRNSIRMGQSTRRKPLERIRGRAINRLAKVRGIASFLADFGPQTSDFGYPERRVTHLKSEV